DPLGDRLEDGCVFGLEQLQAEREGILLELMRQFVDERFDEDSVVIDAYTPPEPGQDVRVPHRMVDEEIRNVVAEIAFRRVPRESLEFDAILAVFQPLRRKRSQDRLAG